jgi:hypothetical protein
MLGRRLNSRHDTPRASLQALEVRGSVRVILFPHSRRLHRDQALVAPLAGVVTTIIRVLKKLSQKRKIFFDTHGSMRIVSVKNGPLLLQRGPSD